MKQCCKTCIFFNTDKKDNYFDGRCDFPLPEWLRIASTGGYIATSELEGENCSVYKSRQHIMESFAEHK